MSTRPPRALDGCEQLSCLSWTGTGATSRPRLAPYSPVGRTRTPRYPHPAAAAAGTESAQEALEAPSRLCLIPVQAAVVETALALARAVLDGQSGYPGGAGSARALTGILDRVLAPGAGRPQPTPAALRSVPTPTVAGTGHSAVGLAG